MARQSEVFVRSLEPAEAQRLVRMTRMARDRVRLRRAGIVLTSVQGRSAPEAAAMFAASARYARGVIHAFNESGFTILRDAGVRWQATKTWKASKDVDFAAKIARVLDLYDHPPTYGRDGRVLCVDEFGPLNLRPRPGRGWFPAGRPAWLRATYNPTGGVRHMFAGLDLATGQTFYRFRDHKRWTEFLAFLKQLRIRFPAGKLYIVCDSYGPHKKAEVTAWSQANDVELVYMPSNASWLNWIECEFTALRYLTLDGCDYASHAAQEAAIAGHVRWHNKNARPKRRFAIDSKIRRPDYVHNVA